MRIILEGCDLAGKSTLAQAVVEELKFKGYRAEYRHGCRNTPEGRLLYNVAMDVPGLDDMERQSLFSIMRSQELKYQAQCKNTIFIMDRWWRSAYAYSGLSLRALERLSLHRDDLSVNDETYIIEYNEEIYKRRFSERPNSQLDAFDIEYKNKIAEIASRFKTFEGNRCVNMIPASFDIESTTQRIVGTIESKYISKNYKLED